MIPPYAPSMPDWMRQVSGSFNAFSRQITQGSSGQWYAEQGATIQRFADRVFVGAAIDNNGTNSGSQPDWLTTQMIAYGRTYALPQISQMAVLSRGNTSGQVALFGAAQTSELTAAGNSIGLTGVAISNNSSYMTQAYAGYYEAYRNLGSLGGAYGFEVDPANFASAVTIDPYQQVGTQTIGVQIASGAEFTSGLFSASAAVNIRKNGSDFLSGIIFGSDAITLSGGIGEAIAFGKGHKQQWYGSAGVKTSSIYSDGSTAANGINFRLGEGFAQLLNASGVQLVQFNTQANAVNYLSLFNSPTATAAQIASNGSDTNIDILLAPKGAGNVAFGTYTAGAPAATGYITIKDAGGTARKVLVG